MKGLQYVGWNRSILPAATFDAGTTEWELAHLMDGDPGIAWWLWLSVGGEVSVPSTAGRYFPDFIAIDTDGAHWLIEGKSDRDADPRKVLTKKAPAEEWARAVRDEGDYGTWRYMFATETHIRQAAGSWETLLAETRPEL